MRGNDAVATSSSRSRRPAVRCAGRVGVPVKTLVGYDGSEPAQRALSVAAELARRSGDVDVGVVHVLAPPGEQGVDHEAEQDALLAEARKLVGERGRSAATLRRRGNPARELIDAARKIEADLVVLGSRGRGALSSAVLGSVSSEVAAAAGCPVVVVPPGARLAGERVIAAADGSDASGEVIAVARELSRLLGVSFLLAHAFAPRPLPWASAVPHAHEELARVERERAEALLAQLAREHGIADEDTRLAEGVNEVDAVVDLAEREHAAAVVVGSRGRTGLKAAVLGSFSSAFAGSGPSPVVIVAPGAAGPAAA